MNFRLGEDTDQDRLKFLLGPSLEIPALFHQKNAACHRRALGHFTPGEVGGKTANSEKNCQLCFSFEAATSS